MAGWVGKHISHLVIKEEISRGGMGQVVRAALQDGRGPDVALKIAHPDKDGDPFNSTAIKGEVEVMRQLHSGPPNGPATVNTASGVVKILQMNWERRPVYVASAHELPGKPWYYAMEYLQGPSLAKHLNKVKSLTISEAGAVGKKVADALGQVHNAGFAHNDIKPENVLFREALGIGSEFQPMLIDFGVAIKHKANEFEGITPRYTSLEKLEVVVGDKPPEVNDPRMSDVWSLGVMLYEMLTGKEPFPGATAKSVITSIRNKKPAPIRAIVKGSPAELDDLILIGCFAHRPKDRPTAYEVATRLAKYGGSGKVEKDRGKWF